MGQAKARGTYEQRKAAAIKRNEKARIARIKARIAKEQAMTPEERKARKERQLTAAKLIGMIGPMPYFLK